MVYNDTKLSFALLTLLLSRPCRAERQSARMSKITNGGLTRSGMGCFIAAVPIWHMATVGVKGLSLLYWALGLLEGLLPWSSGLMRGLMSRGLCSWRGNYVLDSRPLSQRVAVVIAECYIRRDEKTFQTEWQTSVGLTHRDAGQFDGLVFTAVCYTR